jgi:hypothetical protein
VPDALAHRAGDLLGAQVIRGADSLQDRQPGRGDAQPGVAKLPDICHGC